MRQTDRYGKLRESTKWKRLVCNHKVWKPDWYCGSCRMFLPGPIFLCTQLIHDVERPGTPDFSMTNSIIEGLMEWTGKGITCDALLLLYINEISRQKCQDPAIKPNSL